MVMDKFDLKTILDDVRSRDTALLTMLLATDRQAMALFRVYVTLTAALVSVAIAVIFGDALRFDIWVAAGSGAAALGLSISCWFCIQTIKTATVALPGKGAEFWQWAIRDDITKDAVIEAYLQQSLCGQNNNLEVNRQSSYWLRQAKRLGVASLVLGSIIVIVGMFGLASILGEALNHLL